MKIARLLKALLFIYEFVKIIIFIIMMFMLGIKNQFSVILVFTAAGVLFPLMALFVWIDAIRFRLYLPLLIAGKCVFIFILSIWLILSISDTMFKSYDYVTSLARFLLSSDLFSLAAVIIIRKDVLQKISQTEQESEDA